MGIRKYKVNLRRHGTKTLPVDFTACKEELRYILWDILYFLSGISGEMQFGSINMKNNAKPYSLFLLIVEILRLRLAKLILTAIFFGKV